MKKNKMIAAAVSAMLLLTFTGCQDTSTSSIPTISIGDNSENSVNSDTGNSSNAESSDSSTGEQSKTESTTESTTTDDTSKQEPVTSGNDNKGELSGTVIVDATGRGMPIFGGGSGTTYANALNEVKELVGSQVNVFSMIVPTQGSFYMPEGFSMASEWNCIENVNDQLYGIIPVDAYSALAAHVDEEIYARTDHHWMQLGAYYAAEEFVKTARIDVPFTPLSEYERHDVEGYLGTLYGYSDQNATMGKNPETFVYYIAPNDFATYYMNPADADFWRSSMFQIMPVGYSYGTFMGGDEKVVHVDTDVENGRKLLIVKDSYANALVPCLTGSFEDIWIVDMRYLEEMKHFPNSISQIVKEKGITDVLFCMDTFSAVGVNANHLPGIV